MKAAVVLQDGWTQVVLTPETPVEKAVIVMLHEKPTVQRFYGNFYECRGGWLREGTAKGYSVYDQYNQGPRDDDSLIFVLKDAPKDVVEAAMGGSSEA